MNLYLLAAYAVAFTALGGILLETIVNYKINRANKNKK